MHQNPEGKPAMDEGVLATLQIGQGTPHAPFDADAPAPAEGGLPPIDSNVPFKTARDRWAAVFEKAYLSKVLEEHAGNVSAAARTAGVDRIHFYRLLWRNGLK